MSFVYISPSEKNRRWLTELLRLHDDAKACLGGDARLEGPALPNTYRALDDLCARTRALRQEMNGRHAEPRLRKAANAIALILSDLHATATAKIIETSLAEIEKGEMARKAA